MNLILLMPGDLEDGGKRARLHGRRLRHIEGVQRAVVGDVLRVGLLDGLVGSGRITAISPDVLEMEIALDREPPPPHPATLVLALPRPLVLRRVLVSATAMGVKRIVLVGAARVEKSYWQSRVLTDASLHESLLLGLEQARDTRLPEVSLRRRFRPFVEDELPEIASGSLRLAAHPEAEEAFPDRAAGAVTLAIGPEGGFSEYEVSRLAEAGFRLVGLGPRILRVETVVPVLLGRLA